MAKIDTIKQIKVFLFTLLFLIILCGCSTKKSLYRDYFDFQKKVQKPVIPKNKDFTRFMLLGNTGFKDSFLSGDLYPNIIERLETYSKDDYLLLLGDYVKNNRIDNREVNIQLKDLVDLIEKYEGNKLIIPGEKEWKGEGTKGLENVEDFFEERLGSDEHFQPENGCPIETVDIGESIELIIVDSQWYIQDWDKLPNMNDKCELKTRAQFLVELKDKIKKASHKTVVLVMHHPLFSNSLHSGYLPKSTLLQPSSINGYLPIIGSAMAAIRAQGGISKQDRFNPLMNELMSAVKMALNQAPRSIIISSHDEALQYIEEGHMRQIVSGTSQSSQGAALAKNGIFSSGSLGFSEVRIYEDGQTEVLFYGLNENKKVDLLFQKEAYPERPLFNIDSLPASFPQTFKSSIYPREDVKVDAKYEERWGKHYRYVYGIEVEAPVAIIDTLYGGLKVVRAGGGNQTLSLRLEDKDGKEYNMRALAKDPISFLQASGYNNLDAETYFSETMPAELIADFYTAAHPYGAFVIASLSHEIEIKHTHPKLYYVPKQRSLGNFNHEHGNRLYMIEQKPDEDFNDSHMFGRSDDIINTAELLEELRDDEHNQVNEEEYIRARIFDMLLGDWDRHEGQWSWAKQEKGEYNIYSPVPRDRDQVFANFDGNFLKNLQKFMGRTRQFGKYGPDIEFVKNFSESAINLDRAIIQRSSKEVWFNQIDYIQRQLNRQVIDYSFAQVPLEVKDAVWEQIKIDFLLRKDNLDNIVERYLEYFLEFQTLRGTDKDDLFSIQQISDGIIEVSAHRIEDGLKEELLFNRSFNAKETKDLWIYGLDDKDVFETSGIDNPKLNLVIVGGLEGDIYNIKKGRSIAIYDQSNNEEKIFNQGGARIRSSPNYSNRIYNPEVRPSHNKLVGLNFDFNPDEGLVPKVRVGIEKKGFERNPFTSKFLVEFRYISLTQAFDVSPEAHFANIFSRWNLKLQGRITSNNYTENFFGFGNETVNQLNNYDANRIFMQRFNIGISTYRKGFYGSTFEFGTTFKSISAEESNFVDIENALGELSYLSAFGIYTYKSIDNESFPTRGLLMNLHANVSENFQNVATIWSVDPKVVIWNALDTKRKFVLKNSLGGQFRFGSNVPFYQAASLGAESGLRGYRLNRFTGSSSLLTSMDLLYSFKPLKTPLFPLRLNAYLGTDLGRVWYYGNSAGSWHNSYGGGLMMEMAGMINLGMNYFSGREGGRLSFSFVVGL